MRHDLLLKYALPIVSALLFFGESCADTVGLNGNWLFTETEPYVQYDPAAIPMYAEFGSSLAGQIDFDAGTVQFDPIILLGLLLHINGTITGNTDGTYSGMLNFQWGPNVYSGDILWGITVQGPATASIVTLDGDGDGVPGNQFMEGPFHNTVAGNFSPVINGRLTAVVPVPSALWLMCCGMVVFIGLLQRKGA